MTEPSFPTWQWLVGWVSSVGVSIGYHIWSAGRRTGKIDAFLKESESLKTEMRDFRGEVSKMREAFAALTGKTINGANYRNEGD